MANGLEVRITQDNSGQVLSDFRTQKRRALIALGETAERHAKEETPVRTGRLRNSITHQEDENATYVGTNVKYAPYIEFGTSRGIKARHMIKNAAYNHNQEYEQIIKAAFSS